MATFTHELGHACSLIKKQMDMRKGDDSARRAFNDIYAMISSDKEVRCGWDKEIIANQSYPDDMNLDISLQIYKKRYKGLNLSDKTISCFETTAQNSRKLNYKSGNCDDGCPRKYLEEIFAESFKLLSTPKEYYIPDVLPTACVVAKDTTHPMGVDLIDCLAKSDSFIKHLSEMTQCIK